MACGFVFFCRWRTVDVAGDEYLNPSGSPTPGEALLLCFFLPTVEQRRAQRRARRTRRTAARRPTNTAAYLLSNLQTREDLDGQANAKFQHRLTRPHTICVIRVQRDRPGSSRTRLSKSTTSLQSRRGPRIALPKTAARHLRTSAEEFRCRAGEVTPSLRSGPSSHQKTQGVRVLSTQMPLLSTKTPFT